MLDKITQWFRISYLKIHKSLISSHLINKLFKQENSESLLNDEEQSHKNSEESSQEFNLDSPYQKLSDDDRYRQLTQSDKHTYQQFSPPKPPYERIFPHRDDNDLYDAYNNNEPILPQLL